MASYIKKNKHSYLHVRPTMIFTPQSLLFLAFVALYSLLVLFRRHRGRNNDCKPPPGPYALPIIGNLHMLGNLPHRSLSTLAKKHGPIIMIRLGLFPTVVVSSPQAAELFLRTHDAVFANRPKAQASEHLSYGARAVAFTEFGPYWRNARKLCTLELLSPSKIGSFRHMRKEEVGSMVECIKISAAGSEAVDVSAKIAEVTEDMTCKMVFGRCKDDRFDLKGATQEGVRLAGTFNISDFVPWLAPLDLQGLEKRIKAASKELDRIMEMIINEHEQSTGMEHRCKDFIDTLLSLMKDSTNQFSDESYTIDRKCVKAIMVDMVVGSVDTSSSTIQWTMLELLNNPTIMRKVQKELDSVVGLSRMVAETDLADLGYLDMVIKESMRLHPVGPLLVPHESMEDATVDGYFIPKKSRLIVNVWAIGRDTNVWSDNADQFYPERFENSSVDLKGRDFQLLPFGSGRRGCPGLQLGLTTVRIVLAQLVHCFDWEVIGELDMTEKFGLAVQPANHFHAIPTYRLTE